MVPLMAKCGDPTLECTWDKLNKQIAQCEYQTVAAELKADEIVEKEREREAQVLQRRTEIVDAHQKAEFSLRKEFDISLGALVSRTRQDLEEAAALQQHAFERRDDANAKADESARQTAILEREVKRLHALMEQLGRDYDDKHEQMRSAAEEDIKDRVAKNNHAVTSVSMFAAEVEEDAFKSIRAYHQTIHSSANVAYAMAESRSKYAMLAQIGTSRAMEGISEAKFLQEKKTIMTQWWQGWDRHVGQLSPGPQSLAQATTSRPNTPLVPSSPNRARSVQLAREKALMYQTSSSTSPQGISPMPLKALPPVGDRPRTAP